MLIRFIISNFLSFDNEVEFNMIADSFKGHSHHVYKKGKLKLLKSAAIYGANGAGKSNLVKSIEFLQELIVGGEVTRSIKDKKFRLNPENKDKPSSFEIEFIIDSKMYSYGVSIDNTVVIEEWLYETSLTREAKKVFERNQLDDNKISISFASKYEKTKKQKLLIELMEETLLKQNELLLGKTDTLRIPILSEVREWIENGIKIIYPNSKPTALIPSISISKEFKEFTNDLLKTFDTGVTKLHVKSTSLDKFFGEDDAELKDEILQNLEENGSMVLQTNLGSVLILKENQNIIVKTVVAVHKDDAENDVHFEIYDESDGTQRLLDFIPVISDIMNEEVTVIIDEIDQSLHPTLLYTFMKKIMHDKNIKGQFIFTTHESILLDLNIFRQDEIWFVEKDKKKNSSNLYSLSDFKPRHDLDIQKGYLRGRFGAIPFMADLENLNWSENGV